MKKIILLSIFCVLTFSIFAQQNAYNWRIGAYGGYNFYQGDLNSDLNIFKVSQPLNNLPNTDWQGLLSYGGSLEYSSQSFGLKLLGTRGIFQANDRAVNRNGDFIAHTNFDRSLNAQTELYDLSLLATFYSDNGKLLSRTVFVSPYLSIGFGGTYFDVFTNLTDANNRSYHYWSDGLIYDKSEDSQPTDAIQLMQDETFETKATDLQNEGVNYNNLVWNVPLAVGLKFRVSERLNVNLEVMGRYVNSDYLDDVNQRGNSEDKDAYGLASLSLHYNFGQKREDFVPPVFYSLGAEKKGDSNSNANSNSNSNATLETVETVVDTVRKVVIVEMPTALTNNKLFTAEKQTYLEVQKTRLEVAELNEQANLLLKNYDASKVDSFMILNQKIEALSQQLRTYQQYMIGLAVQGNTEHNKPENQAIEKQTSALEAETEVLRQKYRILVLGEDDPKAIEKELAKVEAEKTAEAAKNAILKAEVTALENPQIDTQTVGQPKPLILIRASESLKTTPALMDTSNVEIRGLAGSSDIANAILSDSMALVVNAYNQELKTLSDEVNRLNSIVIPQKNQTIDSLKTKVNYLEGELVGIKETNKYWADFFQKQITSLQSEITKLNQNQTTVPAAKPVVVEKIVAVPTVVTTKTLQDVINEFGISNVYFDNGKTTIKSEFHNRLNSVSSLMNQNPEIIVVLKGYTDKSGNPDLNFKLSKKRAEAVKSYLINQGVSSKNIDITYFGENEAAAVNDPLSRKVEVILMLQ